MRIAALVAKLVGGRAADRDVRAEVDFHIDMRAASYIKAGASPDEAAARARERFGDVEEIMSDMHQARLTSPKAIAITTISVVVIASWAYIAAFTAAPVVFPSLPSLPMKFVKRVPPPPPPPPTWEEFVAKVNRFGDGSARKRRRP
jgi:L-alanine-DL-glutamate epimerase-like enolase superfamily enzyme